MKAWAKDQGVGDDQEGSIINFVADTHGELTDALGMRMSHEGPYGVLGSHRCKRFSALVVDGVIKALNVAEGDEDPAGDDNPTVSLVEQMLKDIDENAK